jgi:hypothetical protein
MEHNKPFSEIIQSCLQTFTAQSWQWDTFPFFGSLVITEQGSRTLFGLVYDVKTGSMDPVRHPFPYQKTQEELLEQQPQIFEFLQTTFSCIVLGYQEKGHIFYQRCPQPPKIHSFVRYAPKELSQQFLYNPHYLNLLFGAQSIIGDLDELLLAVLSHQQRITAAKEQSLQPFMNLYSLLTGNDYRRIKIFLQRVQTILE